MQRMLALQYCVEYFRDPSTHFTSTLFAMQMRANMKCHREPALGEMYALVRSEALLMQRMRALEHQLSDANLQQMPEFQQRVEVLRQMGYVDADNTVQLKVSFCQAQLHSRDAV